MPRQQRREISTGVLLLLYQIFAVGYENIPPVTLATIAAQVAIFLGFIPALDQYRIGKFIWGWAFEGFEWKTKDFRRYLRVAKSYMEFERMETAVVFEFRSRRRYASVL